MKRAKLRRSGDWQFIAAMLGWIGLALGVLGLAAHEIGTPWKPLIVLAAFAPYLMAFAIPAAVLLGLMMRADSTLIALVAIALGVATQAPLYVPSLQAVEGEPVTFLQANLRHGSADPVALVQQVTSRRVDVLTTEELTPGEVDGLERAGIDRALPYHFLAPAAGGSGIGIWSRYPVTSMHDYAGFFLGVLSAQIAFPSSATTVFAVHLTPPYPYPSRVWVAEIANLHDLLAAASRSAGPVLVGGDFNTTPDARQYRALLGAGYSDAAQQAGAGYLATFPTDRWFPPLLELDHVLVRGALAESAKSLETPGSDHRELLVDLMLES